MQILKLRDKVIKCKDCGQDFVWTIDEQAYYQQKKFKPPLRCPICRSTYKEAKKDKFRGRLSF